MSVRVYVFSRIITDFVVKKNEKMECEVSFLLLCWSFFTADQLFFALFSIPSYCQIEGKVHQT